MYGHVCVHCPYLHMSDRLFALHECMIAYQQHVYPIAMCTTPRSFVYDRVCVHCPYTHKPPHRIPGKPNNSPHSLSTIPRR